MDLGFERLTLMATNLRSALCKRKYILIEEFVYLPY